MAETRPYQSTRWPQAERLQHDIGGKEMIEAMLDWRKRNDQPVMCVSNDNYREEDEPAPEAPPQDLRLDTITADRVVALHKAGRSWEPDEERFDRPHRNEPGRGLAVGTIKINGEEYHQAEANAEDELHRVIDTKNLRLRLGVVCTRLLDLASGDSTTEEIAAAVKQPASPRIETYVDWSIIRLMREAV